MMEYGTIKNFNKDRGFGFITILGTYKDVFVHITNVDGVVEEGDKVSFNTEETRKGLSAINVKVDTEGYCNASNNMTKQAVESFNQEYYSEVARLDPIVKEYAKASNELASIELVSDETKLRELKTKLNEKVSEGARSINFNGPIWDRMWEAFKCDVPVNEYPHLKEDKDYDEYTYTSPELDEAMELLRSKIEDTNVLLAPFDEANAKAQAEESAKKEAERLSSLEAEMIALLDGRSVIELSKKEFKQYVRFIVKYEDRNWSSSMSDDNYFIISAIINNGEHNIGYFLPKGGRTRRVDARARTNNEFKISGGKCFTITRWLSRNRNWCSGLQHYRIQGSIDDNFEAIISSLTAE